MEQLLNQLSNLEEEKRKTTAEKDELQQDLLKQKDRMVETEREVGYLPQPGIWWLKSSRLKTSLALIEGDAGGQTKGETTQLQKSLRDLTTESKFKDAEIQKLRDVTRLLVIPLISVGQETRPKTQGGKSEVGKGECWCRSSSTRREFRTHKEVECDKGISSSPDLAGFDNRNHIVRDWR